MQFFASAKVLLFSVTTKFAHIFYMCHCDFFLLRVGLSKQKRIFVKLKIIP